MKNMTTKELTALGKDLKEAKILVLFKHGFSCSEIANITGCPKTVIEKVCDADSNNETVE